MSLLSSVCFILWPCPFQPALLLPQWGGRDFSFTSFFFSFPYLHSTSQHQYQHVFMIHHHHHHVSRFDYNRKVRSQPDSIATTLDLYTFMSLKIPTPLHHTRVFWLTFGPCRMRPQEGPRSLGCLPKQITSQISCLLSAS